MPGFRQCSVSSGQVHLMDECKGRTNPSLLRVRLCSVLQCTGPVWLLDSRQSAGPAWGCWHWWLGRAGSALPVAWSALEPGGRTCLASLSWAAERKSLPCGLAFFPPYVFQFGRSSVSELPRVLDVILMGCLPGHLGISFIGQHT